MYRGSTPTNTFTTTTDISGADVVYISYAQQGRVVIEKDKDDCTFSQDGVSVMLSQQETLRLNACYDVEIQIRAKLPNGKALVSNIIKTTVDRVLKDGVI